MGEDSGDKTEEPTPHKLRESRNKGQIAKSKEFTSAILLFISFYTFKAYAMFMWNHMANLLHSSFTLISTELGPSISAIILTESLTALFTILGPIFLATFVSTLLIEAIQTGFLFAPDALQPKLSAINPIEGFKKFFSLKQYVELFKSLIKMGLVVWILVSVLKDQYFIVSQAQIRDIWVVVGMIGQIVMTVITRVGLLYLILSLLDYFYQRYEYTKQLRMTKKEIKEEYKRLEGDPTVKQRQRDAQRAMAQGRQMGAVPGADVVVTNPTHIAIAVQYKKNAQKAPIVLAKGQRLIADEIKSIAELHYIPIIENPPLAQSLFKMVRVGAEIPSDFYKVIAEILAFVYNLKKKRVL